MLTSLSLFAQYDDTLQTKSIKGTKQHINDDLFVTGSLGLGDGMVNNYSFGFNTIAMVENNLRIYFHDNSSTSSFPSNDWQIEINSVTNGGLDYFRINDITGGTSPFTIEAGAPSHSLYVNGSGRVGMGTDNPVGELHIKVGDTPTMRLEQDGSSGWTPQTWDIAGNEYNFFIRDITEGSQLSFRIQPRTPTNTLTLKQNGNVGIGTWSPNAKLHLFSGTDAASLLFQNNFNSWLLANDINGDFILSDNSTSFNPFKIQKGAADNSLFINNNGDVGIGTDTPLHKLDVAGDMKVDNYFYFGDETTDGNWRVSVIDGKLTFEKRENSVWVSKIEME